MTDQEISHMEDELKKEKEEEMEQEQDMASQQQGMDQQGSDMNMDRDQMGADADAARDEGSAQSDHERQMEVEKSKVRKESVDSKVENTLFKLKQRILSESGDMTEKLASIDRIISRNTKNHQNNGRLT